MELTPQAERHRARGHQMPMVRGLPLLVLVVLYLIAGSKGTAKELDLLFFHDPPIETPSRSAEQLVVRLPFDRLADQSIRVQLENVDEVLSRLREGFVAAAGTAEQLTETLAEGSVDSSLRRKLISALLELDAKPQAETIWQHAKEDLAVSRAVEVRLNLWRSKAALPDWRKRLRNFQNKPSEVLLALQGIGNCGGPEDASLVELWLRRSPSTQVALVAAKSLAKLQPQGNVSIAESILASQRPHAELLAAHLVSRDPAPAVRDLLISFCEQSNEGPVCFVALDALHRNHPDSQFTQLYRQWLHHPDPKVRKLCIAELGQPALPDAIDLMLEACSDPHFQLRELARTHLVDVAQDSQRRGEAVEKLTDALSESSWTVVEQAILALVALDESSVVPRLLELLDHPRGEVNVTAAWALRNQLEKTDRLSQVADRVTRWVERETNATRLGSLHDAHRVTHLIEILGKHRYREIEDPLRRIVPKESGHHPVVRATAIWALGKIWERGVDAGRPLTSPPPQMLVQQLVARMTDYERENAESSLVWYASAIALGRIADPTTLDKLKSHRRQAPSSRFIGRPASWAIEQIQQKHGEPEQTAADNVDAPSASL